MKNGKVKFTVAVSAFLILALIVLTILFYPNVSYGKGFDDIPWGSTWEDISKTKGFLALKDCSPLKPKYETKAECHFNPAYYTITCSTRFKIKGDTQIIFVFEKMLDEYYLIGGRAALIVPTKQLAMLFLKKQIVRKYGNPNKTYFLSENRESVSIWKDDKIMVNIFDMLFEISDESVFVVMIIMTFFDERFIEIEYGSLFNPFI